jgi:hypothetical protein
VGCAAAGEHSGNPVCGSRLCSTNREGLTLSAVTDDLIDEIVYDLYALTDEEIEIVEEAVGE